MRKWNRQLVAALAVVVCASPVFAGAPVNVTDLPVDPGMVLQTTFIPNEIEAGGEPSGGGGGCGGFELPNGCSVEDCVEDDNHWVTVTCPDVDWSCTITQNGDCITLQCEGDPTGKTCCVPGGLGECVIGVSDEGCLSAKCENGCSGLETCPPPDLPCPGECIPLTVADFPVTIFKPRSYCLVENIYQLDGGGIEFLPTSSGSTLYLNGHLLIGGGEGNGISCDSPQCMGITILGPGVVADWEETGIDLNGTGHRIKGVYVGYNKYDGVYLRDGDIEGCTAEWNRKGLITEAGRVSDSRAIGNTGYGIYVDRGVAIGNTVMRNDIGIMARRSTVTDNAASLNNVDFNADQCTVNNNTSAHPYVNGFEVGNSKVTGNTVTEYGDFGFRISDGNTVLNNTAIGTAGAFSVEGYSNRVAGNVAKGAYTAYMIGGGGNWVGQNTAQDTEGFSFIYLLGSGNRVFGVNEEMHPYTNWALMPYGTPNPPSGGGGVGSGDTSGNQAADTAVTVVEVQSLSELEEYRPEPSMSRIEISRPPMSPWKAAEIERRVAEDRSLSEIAQQDPARSARGIRESRKR